MAIILASGSPRRRELMALITPDYRVETSDVDESGITAADPASLVQALARAKCMAVAQHHPEDVVIGCDTVVDCGGEVFGKPRDAADARRMLRALSGRTHAVHTGVCIARGGRAECFADTCRVTFFPIEEADLEAYIASAEPYDKAGGYAIQGWRGTTTPLWASRSAGWRARWPAFERPRTNKRRKKVKKSVTIL